MKTGAKRILSVAAAVATLGAVADTGWAAFEDIEVSPRTRAMGKTYVALGLDAWAPYHNAAALAGAGPIRAAAAYTQPFGTDFSSQSNVAGGVGIGKFGGIGFALRHFGVDYQGEDLTRETTVTLAHGFTLLRDLQSTVNFGWAINYYSLDFGTSVGGIDPGSANVLGLDIAAQATIQERTTVGFYAININNPRIGNTDKEELPRRIGLGAAYTPYSGVTTLFDLDFTQGDETVQYRVGTEFEITHYFLLRGGAHSNPATFTFGAGFRWTGLNIDYGFSSGGGTLNSTHQFGIEYVFPEKKE